MVPAVPGNADFYVVSLRKFYLLYIATLGGYVVYWFYRNWKLQKVATGDTKI